jgi:tRNA (guanine-N7-)-methyltransferase
VLMAGSATLSEEAAQVEFVPADAAQPLTLADMFPTSGPLEVDLGCGDGSFIAARAAEHPHRNFIGVERLVGRVRSACRKIAARHLTNARVLRVDIGQAVNALIPPASVELCHVMFPDPWPKRRHHRRRTVTPDLLQAVSRLLLHRGLLRLTTDDAAYFAQMERAAEAIPELVKVPPDIDGILPRSTFENRFAQRGVPIYRLVLRKASRDR